jgi:Cys-tRNA(Pro)/Cys-tRNA(Cys) deacylase
LVNQLTKDKRFAAFICEQTMSYDTILKLLNNYNANYAIHEHEPMRTAEDIRRIGLFPIEQCLKSVPFQIKNGGWVLATLLAEDTVDYKKLASATGVKRDNLVRPSPEAMQAAFDVEPGSVSPFPTLPDTLVFMDEKAASLSRVYCGIGIVGRTLEIAPSEVLRIANAQALSLAKDH